MITVKIEGLEQYERAYNPDEFEQKFDRGLDEAASAFRDVTKGLPAVSARTTGYGAKGLPTDTGRLGLSIAKRRLQLLALEVYAGVNYSGYVHEGTSRMRGRPFFEWSLQDFGALARMEEIIVGFLKF